MVVVLMASKLKLIPFNFAGVLLMLHLKSLVEFLVSLMDVIKV